MVFSTPLLRIVFAGIFIRNLILWTENSPAAVSFSTLASLFACCFGVSAPLTFLGSVLWEKGRGKLSEYCF